MRLRNRMKMRTMKGGEHPGPLTKALFDELSGEYDGLAITGEKMPLDTLSFSSTLRFSPESLTNPTDDVKAIFLRRKYYETRLWESIRNHIKTIVQPELVSAIVSKLQMIVQSALLDICINNRKVVMDYLIFFAKKENSQQVVNGLLDMTGLLEEFYPLANSIAAANKLSDTVTKFCPNVRTCCHFFYVLMEFFTDEKDGCNTTLNGSKIMGYYHRLFNQCDRDASRELIPTALEPSFQRYRTCIKDRDVFCVPEKSCYTGHDCTKLPEIHDYVGRHTDNYIEQYSPDELGLMHKTFVAFPSDFSGKIPPFVAGINRFYSKNAAINTVDFFAAGISGHTFILGKMMHLYTDITPANIHIVQKLTAISGILLMIDYMHHSLREILLASTTIFQRTPEIIGVIKQIEYLYSPIPEKASFEGVFEGVKDIINSLFNITPMDINSINLSEPTPLMDFFTSPSGMKPSEDILQKITNCTDALTDFIPDLKTNALALHDTIIFKGNCGGPEVKTYKEKYDQAMGFTPSGLAQRKTRRNAMRRTRRHRTRRS